MSDLNAALKALAQHARRGFFIALTPATARENFTARAIGGAGTYIDLGSRARVWLWVGRGGGRQKKLAALLRALNAFSISGVPNKLRSKQITLHDEDGAFDVSLGEALDKLVELETKRDLAHLRGPGRRPKRVRQHG